MSDPEKRKKYDTLGSNWAAYEQGGGPREQYAQQGGRGGGQSFTFDGDTASFFDQFFGNSGGEGFSNQRRSQRGFKGQSVEAEMPITLLEAYQGSQRTFAWKGKNLRITIKPGAYDGQRLRLKGKGEPGINGGAAGDLFILLKIQPDARFDRAGDDLIFNATVDLYSAVLGGKIEVPTMTGSLKVPIPKGSETGKVLRLKGKGMPKYGKAKEHGHLLVKLNVTLPKDLTAEEEALFKKLQAMRTKDSVVA